MANIFDVAKYILSKFEIISSGKLHKLCYYAQAWHYVWTGIPLYANKVIAMKSGPFILELLNEHNGKFSISELHKGDISSLTEDEIDSIDVILQEYGNEEPYNLWEMVSKEAPYRETPIGEEISLDDMYDYYREL